VDSQRSSLLPLESLVPLAAAPAEETLVLDARAGVTPAQMVERKLSSLLRGVVLPVSWLLSARPRWSPCRTGSRGGESQRVKQQRTSGALV
jgi:hypothetical protein